MRRFLILLLIFTLLLGALPCYSVPVDGLSLYEWEDELMKKCEDILKVVHHDGYFDGGCAAWTSDQLRYNDVGYWYKGKYSSAYDDGNKWFYDLDEGAVTKSGYTQVRYPGENALYDLISEFGGHPIYNVVVSWQKGNGKWAAEGHVLYIWCIRDGNVYYTDTFDSILGEAGKIIKRPIDQFVSVYDQSSGPMIGAVHFEGAETVGFHPDETVYSEYIAKEGCTLRTTPLEVPDAYTVIESVDAGTVLSVRGAHTDAYGQRWLKLDGGKWVKAIDAEKRGNYSTFVCESISVPKVWMCRHGFTMSGTVISRGGAFTYLSVSIIDSEGKVVSGGEIPVKGSSFSIAEIDETTYFEQFPAGTYRYRIEAKNAREHAVILDAEFEMRDSTRYRDERKEIFTEAHKLISSYDTDMNGSIDSEDAKRIREGSTRGNGGYLCDVNGDGYVNLTDMYLIDQEITKASE